VTLYMRVAAISDVGRVRKNNEDSGYAGEHLVMIADGVGGAAAGDLASTVAVETIRRIDVTPESDLLEILAGAVHRANDRIGELVDEDPAVEGMGTTLTAALFDGDQIALAHIGDSRGYLFRDGTLTQLTIDHTWVQSMVDDGEITAEQARVHAHRNVILKVLQGRDTDEPDLSLHEMRDGDRLLLCSDGLSDYVDPERIEQLAGVEPLEQVASNLVQLALEAGAPDNVSVVVAEITSHRPEAVNPVTIGVAAEHKGPLSRLRHRAHRLKDTGELSPVDAELAAEAQRYAPRAPHRFRWLRRVVYTLVLLALLAGAGGVTYGWTQRQYYVSATDGHVAIFKGVQADVPGLTLSRVFERKRLLLSQLPTYRRNQVRDGLPADNLADARNIVTNLQGFANECAQLATQPPTTPTTRGTSSTSTPRTGHPSSRTPPTRRLNPTHTAGAATASTPPSVTPGGPRRTGDTSAECAGATPLTPPTTGPGPTTTGPSR
jgi:PPM family protein phosphatase